jgi:hypothetical protein
MYKELYAGVETPAFVRGQAGSNESTEHSERGGICPAGAEALTISLAFSAQLKPHPIDEDLSMGTPVKLCPDARLALLAGFLSRS